MHKITKSDFLAIAKRCGWAGSETDYEAMRTHILASKYARSIQDANGASIDVKAVSIVDEPAPEPFTVKTVADNSTATNVNPKSDSFANPTNDIQTLVNAAVANATKGFTPGNGNPNRAIAVDTVTVTPIEELNFKSQARHIKSGYLQAKKFQTHLYANVFGNTPQMMNHPEVVAARKRLAEDPIYKAYGSSTNAGGGALTFMEFVPDLIANVNQFGACRKLAKVFPMSQETAFYPVRQGIHALTYQQQNVAVTPSTSVTYSNVQLTAKTGTCIVQLSKQLVWDANISVVDDMFGEIARCIAYTEDLEFFTGAAQASYAGIRGYTNRFIGGGYTGGGTWTAVTHAATAAALGTTDSATTMAEVSAVLAKVPSYARQNMAITCTPQVAARIFMRLAAAQGGVTWTETQNYGYVMKFLGIPIVENNVMTAVDDAGSGTIKFLVGDFSKSAIIGDRMGVELDANDSVYWTSNGVGLKGTIRHDMVIHDVGDTASGGDNAGRLGPVAAGYEVS